MNTFRSRLGQGLSRVFLLVAALFSAASLAQQTTATLPLWEVRSDTNTIYLFGTIHVGRSDFYPLPREVERAYSASKALVLELDPTDTNAFTAALPVALYQPPDNLENHVSKKTSEKLRTVLQRYGVSLEQVRQMKPFMVMLTLTSLEYTRLGYDATAGLDYHLAQRASRETKPIVQLESAAGQLAMLNNMSAELQAELLRITLEEIGGDEVAALVKEMISAWKRGDSVQLAKILSEEERRLPPALASEFHEKFISRRNIEMLGKVERMLKGAEPQFVAIGAGHLTGSDGLVALLSKKGYKVTQK